MNSKLFKQGTRAAWRVLQNGGTPALILTIYDNRDDDYHLGWIAQAEDPETELHPPDYQEDPDFHKRGWFVFTAFMSAGALVVLWFMLPPLVLILLALTAVASLAAAARCTP